MKRALAAIAFWLCGTPAFAGISCTLPFNLANGTTADASQVMANYNALVSCLALAAHAGGNTDITSISGLTTPLIPTQGGANTFLGGTATLSGTTYQVSATTPANFSLQTGYQVVFVANSTNPGAVSLQVSPVGAVNLWKQTPSGPQAMTGGEIRAGQIVTAIYDGTQFETLPPAIVATHSITVSQQNFSTAGANTYTPTTGTQYAKVELCGAGGGGGGSASATGGIASAGGGGGGGYAFSVLSSATIGASQTVTIGTGGTAGTAGNNPGGNGGATTFGALVAAGGGGGGSGAPVAGTGTGGSAGAGTSGQVILSGSAGGTGIGSATLATLNAPSGYGGPGGVYGTITQGALGALNGATTGTNGLSCSGGSGGRSNNSASNAAGGAGGNGLAIITEYQVN